MTEAEVKCILKNKQKVMDGIPCCQRSDLREILTLVMDNLSMFETDYSNLIDGMLNSSVNYSSYYNTSYSALENIEYFKSCYQRNDKDEQMKKYLLYAFFRNVDGLVSLANEEEFSDFNELAEWFDFDTYYDDLVTYSEELRKSLELEEMIKKDAKEDTMAFMRSDNPYKILFTGLAYDDVKELPRHIRLQVMKKLYSPLATETVVPLAEGVDHVRDSYGFPLQRIRVGDGYRIVFVRHGDVTAIVGAKGKTGKANDYTRYDSVARDANKIYAEMEEFSTGIVPPSDAHVKTVELLQDAYDKSREK